MIRKVKVFISSPNDLEAERDICKRVIDDLNMVLPKKCNSWIDAYFWEEQTRVIGMGSAQRRIESPSNYDLYIGMLGKRYGTPTGDVDPETGEKYKSGTEQEFKEAYRAWKESDEKKPEIKFLRKKVTAPTPEKGEEYEQYQRVNAFFKEFEEGGKHPGLVKDFRKNTFEKQIRKILEDYCEQTQSMSYLSHHYSEAGIVGLFLPKDSDKRNELKKNALHNSETMRLVAHAGYSYLSDSPNRFYPYVRKLLDQGGHVQVILANPYSEMGYYVTAGNLRRDANEDSLVDLLKQKSVQQIISEIPESDWVVFKRKSAIRGYEEMKKKYSDRIHLKVCSYEMHSTILLTDQIAFVEPYLHCVGAERGMNVFEVCAEKKDREDNPYKVLSEYFDFLWMISEDYDQYLANEDKHKEQLEKRMKDMKALLEGEPAEV